MSVELAEVKMEDKYFDEHKYSCEPHDYSNKYLPDSAYMCDSPVVIVHPEAVENESEAISDTEATCQVIRKVTYTITGMNF